MPSPPPFLRPCVGMNFSEIGLFHLVHCTGSDEFFNFVSETSDYSKHEIISHLFFASVAFD